MKEGEDYKIIKLADYRGIDYYQCLSCSEIFERRYHSKRLSNPYQKQYGTKQLMALWAWYNFERHMKACKLK